MLKEYKIVFLAITLKDLTLKSTKALRIFATLSGQLDSQLEQNPRIAITSFKCLYIAIIRDKHNQKLEDYAALKIAITKLSEKEIKDKLNTKECKTIKKNI